MNRVDNQTLSRRAVSLEGSPTGPRIYQQENIMTTATSASTMQLILSTEGYDGLREFLNRLPTQQIEELLVASEMRATPRLQQEYSRTNFLPSGYGYEPRIPRTSSLLMSSGPFSNSTTMSSPNSRVAPVHDNMMAESSSHPLHFETRLLSEQQQRPIAPAAQEQLDLQNFDHAASLFVETDSMFLDPFHNFLRCKCIEVFVATKNDMIAPGRGARPTKVGQVGLRCLYCKDIPRQDLARMAVCFPSRRDTIFEGVRNYQRTHLEACTHIPEDVKAKYKLIQHDSPKKKPQKILKAYYAETASELGLVDTTNGLAFGAPPNRTGIPSERLRTLIRAAESPTKFASFCKAYSSVKNEAIQMKKFEHIASGSTRKVITNARKEPSPFVCPQDFPTISDVDFLLFCQVRPFKPSAEILEKRGLDAGNTLSGLCCKHCARANAGENTSHHRGVYFPTDVDSLAESSFSQTLLNHLMSCPNVPQEIKNALDELKQLAVEHGIIAKRGSKKNFFKKIWRRMETYYE